MFANPLLASKMQRSPVPSEIIIESFHTPVYADKVPLLSVSWREGLIYKGDWVKCRQDDGSLNYAKVAQIRLDGMLETTQCGVISTEAVVEIVEDLGLTSTYRLRAGGKKVVHIGFSLFTDATSGNTSSAWNFIDGWQMRVHSLPRVYQDMRLLNCTRSHDWQDVMRAILADMEELQKGILVYDEHNQETILVVASLLAITADGPRQSQLLGIVGPSGNHNCVCCEGTRRDLFPGNPRSVELLRERRMTAQQEGQSEQFTISRYGVSQKPNPLVECMMFDAVELFVPERLHLISLGIAEYTTKVFRAALLDKSKVSERTIVQARFESLPRTPGYNISALQLLNYTASLTGNGHNWLAMRWPLLLRRDSFDSISPYAGPFLINGEFDDERLLAPVSVQQYALALSSSYIAKIYAARTMRRSEMDQFCARHDEAVAAYHRIIVDFFANLIGRIKIHLLLHVAELFRRFGPLMLWDAQAGEHANGTIRNHIINSNRQDVSKAVLNKWCIRDAVQDILDGGRGIGAQLKTFVQSETMQRLSRHQKEDKAWGKGYGVSWVDTDETIQLGVIVDRGSGDGDSDINCDWFVLPLARTGVRDELLVGYKLKRHREASGMPAAMLRIHGSKLHAVDLIQHAGPQSEPIWWRNIMFHDNIIDESDHQCVMDYIRRCIPSPTQPEPSHIPDDPNQHPPSNS